MRISIATGSFLSLPPAPCGSLERVWHDIGLEFARRGHQVTFLACGYPGLPEDEVVGNVTYLRRGYWKRSGSLLLDLGIDLAYSTRMLAHLPPADFLINNVFWLPVLACVRPGAGKRVVILNRHPKGQLFLYRGATRVVAVSQAVMDTVAQQSPGVLGITRVIPSFIDVGTFVPPTAPRSFAGEKVFLFTGRIHPEKGLDLLIDAFAQVYRAHPDTRLRIIGPSEIHDGGGGEDFVRSLRARAIGLPVDILPPIYHRGELAATLQAAHYYCYPSLAEKGESFGVAPLEAMATGLVPVVSALNCFRDFVESDVNGWIFNHRGAGAEGRLADCMREALRDPARTAEMGRRAAQRASEFSCSRIADIYISDFESILADADKRHSHHAQHEHAAP